MTAGIAIRPESAKALSARDERDLLRLAFARDPGSMAMRMRLAQLQHRLDAFDETIALLTPVERELDWDGARLLASAYFARDGADDTAQAARIAQAALTAARNDAERSAALADQAKALLRLGQIDAACAHLRHALALDPTNRDAFKRLGTQLLRTDPPAALALAEQMQAKGVTHSRLIALRTMALAALGRAAEARAVAGVPALLHRDMLEIPAGWADLDGFNTALVAELSAHPGLRDGRHGTASRGTWRIDDPATGSAPAARALLDQIARAIESYVDAAAPGGHAWLTARPQSGVLRSWCVITGGDGFEEWHTHPQGWLSGGYYAEVPRGVAMGGGRAGCLAFGLPGGSIGAEGARDFGETLIRPRAGLLTLFPSHSYHRTFAHGCDGQRICVAFDILPD